VADGPEVSDSGEDERVESAANLMGHVAADALTDSRPPHHSPADTEAAAAVAPSAPDAPDSAHVDPEHPAEPIVAQRDDEGNPPRDWAGENESREEERSGTGEDPDEAAASGAADGGSDDGGPGDTDLSDGREGDGEDEPWKRDPDELDPDTRRTYDLWKQQGPNDPTFNFEDDTMVIAYEPQAPGGSGYISGKIDSRPDHSRATMDMLTVTPGMRGLGLSSPLVEAFAEECDRQGIEVIDGHVYHREELGALHHVFGDRITFGAPDTDPDNPEMLNMTPDVVLTELPESPGLAPSPGESPEPLGPSYYFQVRPADRLAITRQVDALAEGEVYVDLSQIETDQGTLDVTMRLAEEIHAGNDVTRVLDEIAEDHPAAGAIIAAGVQEMYVASQEPDSEVQFDPNLDIVLWVKANLSNNLRYQGVDLPIDAALREHVNGDEHEVGLYSAATTWAPFGDKTIGRAYDVAFQMKTVEETLTEDPGLLGIDAQDIIARHRGPANDDPIEGYNLQPLTSELMGSSSSDPDSPRVGTVTDRYVARARGTEPLQFPASGPMGVMIDYRGVPQQVVTFDVHADTITIRDIEPAAPLRQTGEPPERPVHMRDVDMSAVAFELIPRVCTELDLVSDPDRVTLRVISAENNPTLSAREVAEAAAQYDEAAAAWGMTRDEAGNWTIPLNRLHPPEE
jgi:GNAT superfamily N-acetyltransferase